MKRYLLVLALFVAYIPTTASLCNPNAPTAVASVADAATKGEQAADQALKTAVQMHAVVIPSTGKPVLSEDQLGVVALAVDKVGREGTHLKDLLSSISALRASGADASAMVVAAKGVVDSLVATLQEIGKAIPNGVVQAIDNAVAESIGAYASIKLALGK